jgi:hypothetical protein
MKRKRSEYVVVVGNIGNIPCEDRKEAKETYDSYVLQSKTKKGRAGGEPVTLLKDGEPIYEFYYEQKTTKSVKL